MLTVASKVPVLIHDTNLSRPMPESVDITYFLCDRYPQLLPDENKDQIKALIEELHTISFYALSFAGQPGIGIAHLAHIDKLLGSPNISQRHRDALQYKKTQ